MGVSKFHAGRRNARGLELLLDAFSHAAARITHLDLRANGLSTADAAAVLAVALRADAACTHLRVHQWGVRVRQLANNVALAKTPKMPPTHPETSLEPPAVLTPRTTKTPTTLALKTESAPADPTKVRA